MRAWKKEMRARRKSVPASCHDELMAPRRQRPLDPPSPILTEEQVVDALAMGLGRLAQFGAMGGGAAARAGRAGASFGSRHTMIKGESRYLIVPFAARQFDVLCAALPEILVWEPEQGHLAGLTGSGFFNMNPTVIQAVLDGDGLLLTAHAHEGLIGQRSAAKALGALVVRIAPGD